MVYLWTFLGFTKKTMRTSHSPMVPPCQRVSPSFPPGPPRRGCRGRRSWGSACPQAAGSSRCSPPPPTSPPSSRPGGRPRGDALGVEAGQWGKAVPLRVICQGDLLGSRSCLPKVGWLRCTLWLYYKLACRACLPASFVWLSVRGP